MVCPSCSHDIPAGARFCTNCGAQIPQSQAATTGDVVAIRSTVITGGTISIGAGAQEPTGGECPICGRYNRRERTFRCRECNRPLICLEHRDARAGFCAECAEKRAAQAAQAEADAKRAQLALTLVPGMTIELVRVPAGEFHMGSVDADAEAYDAEKPQHTVTLAEYLIGKYPVTNAQYTLFARATRRDWMQPEDKDNHPAVNVSWDDAVAFCAWAGQISGGRKVYLPSEAQWEKAARSTDGRLYPWGNEAPGDSRLNFKGRVRGTTPVGTHSPLGDSPYGAADMAGNIWEWTSSLHRPYPYQADDGREDRNSPAARVLRGGGFFNVRRFVRCAYRTTIHGNPMSRFDGNGFRVAVAPV